MGSWRQVRESLLLLEDMRGVRGRMTRRTEGGAAAASAGCAGALAGAGAIPTPTCASAPRIVMSMSPSPLVEVVTVMVALIGFARHFLSPRVCLVIERRVRRRTGCRPLVPQVRSPDLWTAPVQIRSVAHAFKLCSVSAFLWMGELLEP